MEKRVKELEAENRVLVRTINELQWVITKRKITDKIDIRYNFTRAWNKENVNKLYDEKKYYSIFYDETSKVDELLSEGIKFEQIVRATIDVVEEIRKGSDEDET